DLGTVPAGVYRVGCAGPLSFQRGANRTNAILSPRGVSLERFSEHATVFRRYICDVACGWPLFLARVEIRLTGLVCHVDRWSSPAANAGGDHSHRHGNFFYRPPLYGRI